MIQSSRFIIILYSGNEAFSCWGEGEKSINDGFRPATTEKKAIAHPDKQFTYGVFSAGVAVDGWLYVSGQGPLDMKTGKRVEGTIEEETALALSHLEKYLVEGIQIGGVKG